jgi:hypothetical protein
VNQGYKSGCPARAQPAGENYLTPNQQQQRFRKSSIETSPKVEAAMILTPGNDADLAKCRRKKTRRISWRVLLERLKISWPARS